jgi:hypothetical protein
MWTLYSKEVAIVINIILMVFLLLFVKNGYEIYDKLHVKDEDAVQGTFTNFADAQNMEDIAQGNNRSHTPYVDRPVSAQGLPSA